MCRLKQYMERRKDPAVDREELITLRAELAMHVSRVKNLEAQVSRLESDVRLRDRRIGGMEGKYNLALDRLRELHIRVSASEMEEDDDG